MFETLRQSLKTGVVTTNYPQTPPEVSSRARGKPEIDWANWKDARPAAAVCPTGAIELPTKMASASQHSTWASVSSAGCAPTRTRRFA